MKLLLTAPYYPPHVGGIEIHTRAIAHGMRARGCEVEVVSSTGRDEHVKVITVPCVPIPYSPIPLSFPDVHAEVYHSHIPSSFFARWVVKKGYGPHLVTYHNDVVIPSRVGGSPVPGFLARRIERQHDKLVRPVLDTAATIIATTRSYAETSPVLGAYLEKVEIVPNAIRVADFLPGKDAGERDAIVLYAGRLVAYKGLGILLEAMKQQRSARLVVVGDGEDRSRFEALARRCGVMAEFKGRLPDAELKSWMQMARVLVLPAQSRLEAFGIALLEAMASRTPVIASNLPGVAEVAQQGGLVFEDTEELSLNLTRLLEDDALATQLGRKGRAAVERDFDWESVLDKLEALYKR
jgi:glycosyltransferase involved in cell wall biosynthesis